MKRFLFLLIAMSGLFVCSFAQDGVIWKGLAFDSTTQEQAVAILGKPANKRVEKIKVYDVPGGRQIGEDEIQIIEFKKIDNWEKVSLGFAKGRLFKAKFWPRNKTMRASELPASYVADFVFTEGFAKGVPLSVFDGQKEPTVPKVYPTIYFMISAKPDRYILANINNGSFGALWKQMGREATVQLFPGFVEDIEIISRIGEPK